MNKKLTVVVPYRNRKTHLKRFIPSITEALTTQKIDFYILIVEQTNEKPFNRAKLLNIGFSYSRAESDYYCFHDVDMLPVESDYTYCDIPTHLAARAEQFGWKLPYDKYFGGVTLFDRESFLKINGYANEYWGWGGEDDDIYNRCVYKGIIPRRKDCSFKSLEHKRIIDKELYHKNIDMLNNFNKSISDGNFIDGVTNVEYKLIKEYNEEKYKKILVKI